MVTSYLISLRMRDVSDKSLEKMKTHFTSNIYSFESGTVPEVMWKNIVEPDRPQMTI